jgi:hypothetical protein
MSVAPRLLLVLAACAAAPPPAFGSPYTDSIETAVLSLCPMLRSGRISPDNPDELTRLGYFRTPELEEDQADAEDGVPFLFTRGRGAEAVTIGYWPYPQYCSVSFGGHQAAAAVARIKARMEREPRIFRRAAEADWELDGVRHEAWQVVRRSDMCLAIETPAGTDPDRYSITYEPLPVLHPGVVRSACAPSTSP